MPGGRRNWPKAAGRHEVTPSFSIRQSGHKMLKLCRNKYTGLRCRNETTRVARLLVTQSRPLTRWPAHLTKTV